MDYARDVPPGRRMDLHRTSKDSHTIMKSSSSSSSSSSSNSSGSGGRHQQQAKHVPVIRVVHIFNPTVIKTDAANFRSLVQELTGRSCKTDNKGTRAKFRSTSNARRQSSVYDGQLKQLQTTAKDFMSQKSQLLGYMSATESARMAPQMLIGNLNCTVPKRNPMYIPERLGTFNDVDILSSLQEPLMDFSSMLPSLSDLHDDTLHGAMPRFTSFYESF